MSQRILFISTMGGYPWGGSEELWSRTALDLHTEGFSVAASVVKWSPLHPRVVQLREHGLDIWVRSERFSLFQRAVRRLAKAGRDVLVAEVEKCLAVTQPALIVCSSGIVIPPIELLELCAEKQVPFVTIGHANHIDWWPTDEDAERLRRVLPVALRCYFVSDGNRRLAEQQIGCELTNAEVVWNPFNVDFHASPPWPPLDSDNGLQLACVGRLHPPSKGQDILLEVLAQPTWQDRAWRLNVYGEGPMRNTLERLAQRLGLANRVVFAGHATVENIWTMNHVLVMPSRYEGLPLAIVEAMLCARPVVTTDVAGHAEVIEDGVTGFLADSATVGSMTRALERLWVRRVDSETIGKAGSKRIRQLVPVNPAREFSRKLKILIGGP